MNAPALSCPACSTRGTWCGRGRTWPIPLPCAGCGELVATSGKCGTMHCARCAAPEAGPTQPAPAPEPAAAGPVQDSPGPVWEGRKAQRERAAARLDAEQPVLRGELVAAGVDAATAGRAVKLWNELMRGITYSGGHRTALGILNGSFRHRGVPDLPEPHPAELAPPWDGPVWSARSWIVRGAGGLRSARNPEALDFAAATGGSDLGGFDVNGMYLSAAAIELGTGEPVRRQWPGDEVLNEPGWVQVAELEGAPWSIADRWQPGMAMRTELVAYLADAGAEFLIPESVTQPNHRRWLDPHVDLLRAARAALVDADTPEAAALLPFVKNVYTRMFGGLLESERHNDSRTLRPWWKAGIVATGQARMFRGLDKVTSNPAMCVGVHVDAAWFVMPRGFEVPPGLDLSSKLGKWKPAGRTRWTPELAAAYAAGEPRPLWRALHAAEATE